MKRRDSGESGVGRPTHDIARDAGECLRCRVEHLLHARGRRVEPGEIAHGQLEAVENVG